MSSIPIAFVISLVGFIAQDRVDLKKAEKKLQSRINELIASVSHKDIYAMTKYELYEHCRSCGLDDADCKIAELVIIERLKGQALYYAIGYSERQSKRKRQEILSKIK